MSSQKIIVNGTEFSPKNDVVYMKPKVNAVGGKNVGILNAKTKKATYLSTPLMLTWGVNEYVDDKTGRKTYDMSLQFPRSDYSNASTDKFLENMIAFEEKLKADAMANSKLWMNKTKMSSDVVDALWTPMLRYPKHPDTGEPDTTRPPTLRLKIPFWEGEWRSELYDLNHELIFPKDDGLTPVDLVTKGTNLAAVIQCGGIWFANGKFGVTWKLIQAMVKPKATLRGKCHIQLNDDEKKVMESQQVDSEEEEEEQATIVDDSDDEEEEEVVVEPEPKPEPPKKKKKRVVRKKKTAQ